MTDVAAPPAAADVPPSPTELHNAKHSKFLSRCLYFLPTPYDSLDVQRTMAAFFCLGGLDVLDTLEAVEDKAGVIEWIYSLQVVGSSTLDAQRYHT